MDIDVNISLDKIANWLKANKLTMNVKKANLLVFDSRKTARKNLLLSYLLTMRNLNKKILQNI